MWLLRGRVMLAFATALLRWGPASAEHSDLEAEKGGPDLDTYMWVMFVVWLQCSLLPIGLRSDLKLGLGAASVGLVHMLYFSARNFPELVGLLLERVGLLGTLSLWTIPPLMLLAKSNPMPRTLNSVLVHTSKKWVFGPLFALIVLTIMQTEGAVDWAIALVGVVDVANVGLVGVLNLYALEHFNTRVFPRCKCRKTFDSTFRAMCVVVVVATIAKVVRVNSDLGPSWRLAYLATMDSCEVAAFVCAVWVAHRLAAHSPKDPPQRDSHRVVMLGFSAKDQFELLGRIPRRVMGCMLDTNMQYTVTRVDLGPGADPEGEGGGKGAKEREGAEGGGRRQGGEAEGGKGEGVGDGKAGGEVVEGGEGGEGRERGGEGEGEEGGEEVGGGGEGGEGGAEEGEGGNAGDGKAGPERAERMEGDEEGDKGREGAEGEEGRGGREGRGGGERGEEDAGRGEGGTGGATGQDGRRKKCGNGRPLFLWHCCLPDNGERNMLERLCFSPQASYWIVAPLEELWKADTGPEQEPRQGEPGLQMEQYKLHVRDFALPVLRVHPTARITVVLLQRYRGEPGQGAHEAALSEARSAVREMLDKDAEEQRRLTHKRPRKQPERCGGDRTPGGDRSDAGGSGGSTLHVDVVPVADGQESEALLGLLTRAWEERARCPLDLAPDPSRQHASPQQDGAEAGHAFPVVEETTRLKELRDVVRLVLHEDRKHWVLSEPEVLQLCTEHLKGLRTGSEGPSALGPHGGGESAGSDRRCGNGSNGSNNSVAVQLAEESKRELLLGLREVMRWEQEFGEVGAGQVIAWQCEGQWYYANRKTAVSRLHAVACTLSSEGDEMGRISRFIDIDHTYYHPLAALTRDTPLVVYRVSRDGDKAHLGALWIARRSKNQKERDVAPGVSSSSSSSSSSLSSSSSSSSLPSSCGGDDSNGNHVSTNRNRNSSNNSSNRSGMVEPYSLSVRVVVKGCRFLPWPLARDIFVDLISMGRVNYCWKGGAEVCTLGDSTTQLSFLPSAEDETVLRVHTRATTARWCLDALATVLQVLQERFRSVEGWWGPDQLSVALECPRCTEHKAPGKVHVEPVDWSIVNTMRSVGVTVRCSKGHKAVHAASRRAVIVGTGLDPACMLPASDSDTARGVEVVPAAVFTAGRFVQALAETRPSIVHVCGCGEVCVADSPQTRLAVELDGGVEIVGTDFLLHVLGRYVRDGARLALVYLNFPRSLALARSLRRVGVEAVVCWEDSVPCEAAARFAHEFYRRHLGSGACIVDALVEARAVLGEGGAHVPWLVSKSSNWAPDDRLWGHLGEIAEMTARLTRLRSASLGEGPAAAGCLAEEVSLLLGDVQERVGRVYDLDLLASVNPSTVPQVECSVAKLRRTAESHEAAGEQAGARGDSAGGESAWEESARDGARDGARAEGEPEGRVREEASVSGPRGSHHTRGGAQGTARAAMRSRVGP